MNVRVVEVVVVEGLRERCSETSHRARTGVANGRGRLGYGLGIDTDGLESHRDAEKGRTTDEEHIAFALDHTGARGMGRWGVSDVPSPGRDVVGLMSHLASAESDPAFTQLQIERFKEATAGLSSLTRHVANSAATLRSAEARFDPVRWGVALYGISPVDAGYCRSTPNTS